MRYLLACLFLVVAVTSFAQTSNPSPSTPPTVAATPPPTPQPPPIPAATPTPPSQVVAKPPSMQDNKPAILTHLQTWSPLYDVIGQLATALAVAVGGISILVSVRALAAARRAVAVTEQASAAQVEWQQRVTEKQIYFQIVHAEWSQAMANWNDGQRSGAAVGDAPNLRELLIAAGVMKKGSNPKM